jgi:TRAP-type C4-dicarboxylate transport system permease small subunit
MVHLRRLSDALNRAAIAFCVACVLAMLAISFIGFFYMQGTGEALSWTYSLARLFVPWIGMLSITIAFKGGEHVTMNLLLGLVPAALTRAMQWASVGLIGLFALLLLWFGWDFFLGSNQYYMVSDQIRIHGRWVAACIPVTGAVLLVHLADGVRLIEAPPLDLGED